MNVIINKVTAVTVPIRVAGLDFSYAGAPVFRGLDLTIPVGVVTALTGPNGCGKSTLLGLLAGVQQPDAGSIRAGTDNVAFAVQRSRVTDSFPVTVSEAVMMGRWRHLGLLRRPKAADRAIVEHWLATLGIAELRHRTLGELSGGQRQRVLLAQAFVQEAPLLLLDEPTTGLDAASAALLIAHLRRLADDGATVIAATHDAAVMQAADGRLDLAGQGGALG
ncbi:MAG: metal ABC transporter ATP-binding protein [Mycolicibacterium frederiksbergense]|uniref:Metal ABC transporter ATP-binding protein n=1 Tax=Mycolicibacterium frederiksbergense TaxID=117567 RepID=A0A6H0S4Y6_9MYCO|nr:metal ABC transporter ATP-binding protein [Mycolicibacterium frederiksbergense]QIV82662.1 metal ABC transporter ATP-binding protein [Mycolicibacterium frederiksbergense]